MNPSINYREVLSGVQEEIKMLDLEKARLAANLAQVQNRLAEIQLKTDKLHPIAQSLTDLLETIPLIENGEFSDGLLRSQNGTGTNQTGLEQFEESESANNHGTELTQKKMTQVGESLFDELFGPPFSETAETENGVVEINASSQPTEQFTDNENNVGDTGETLEEKSASEAEVSNESQITTNDSPPNTSDDSSRATAEKMPEISASQSAAELTERIQKKIPQDFDRADFYSHYPHLKGVQQTVPTLARNLLAYFNYGLKLSEITRLILALGHQHHSQNFTNSVHSSLRQKQAATRDFFFNPTSRVWELAHWSQSGESGQEPQRAAEGKSSGEGEKPASHNEAAQNRKMARKLTAEFSQTLQAKNRQPNDKKSSPGGKQIRVIKKDGK